MWYKAVGGSTDTISMERGMAVEEARYCLCGPRAEIKNRFVSSHDSCFHAVQNLLVRINGGGLDEKELAEVEARLSAFAARGCDIDAIARG